MEKNIGERLREIRKENGDTQEKLAEILNYSVKTIRRYENSKTHPTNEFLSLFGVHYNVSFDYLLRGEEGMDTKTYKPDNTDCVEEAEMYFEKYLEAKKKLMQTDYDSEERLFIIVEKYGDSWFSRYGAITEWVGFTDDVPPRERRVPRDGSLKEAIGFCDLQKRKFKIISNRDDVFQSSDYIGLLIMRHSIVEQFFPHILKPFYKDYDCDLRKIGLSTEPGSDLPDNN